MRRFLTDLAAYPEALGRSVLRGWDAFFFRPADPTALGLIRLAVGALAFWSLLVYGLDLSAYFGPDGWANVATVQAVVGRNYPYNWSFWFYTPDALIVPAWIVCLVILALFSAGLFSRVTAVLAWIIIVSTVRRLPVAVFGFDQHVSTWALYLAICGASGQAVSLDRTFQRWREARGEAAKRRRDGRWTRNSGVPRPTVAANLGLRLIQLHLCLIYGMAGLAKLQGAAWWNGTAIWGTLAAGEFRLFDLTWLAAFPWLLNLLTHAGLAIEVSYPVLVWVRPLRPLVLAAMLALHVGIELTLGLGEFAAAMIAANLAFVSGAWLRSLVTDADEGGGAARVVYDGACPRCRASLALAIAADPDHAIEPVDLTAVDVATIDPSLTREATLRAMHLVEPDGRVRVGYDAVVALARRLPLFWPLGLIGSIPGVSLVGHRVYNAVAARRRRDVPCSDEVCGLP